jgi:hypothetical protein
MPLYFGKQELAQVHINSCELVRRFSFRSAKTLAKVLLPRQIWRDVAIVEPKEPCDGLKR